VCVCMGVILVLSAFGVAVQPVHAGRTRLAVDTVITFLIADN